jgi:acetyl-CoA carboxylase biotin carboxyl carrier protein
MTLDEIRDLIKTVCDSGIAELEVQRGDNRVWIKRAGDAAAESAAKQSGGATTPFAQITVPATPAAPAAASDPAQEPDLTDPTLKAINAPIVGTYYEAASPGSDAFVRPGDIIKPGKILCIIESMKLMNEIEAEISGTIVKCLVENGQPVEYGETLFLVKPN